MNALDQQRIAAESVLKDHDFAGDDATLNNSGTMLGPNHLHIKISVWKRAGGTDRTMLRDPGNLGAGYTTVTVDAFNDLFGAAVPLR